MTLSSPIPDEIGVVVADALPVSRAAMATLLEHRGFRVRAEVADADAALWALAGTADRSGLLLLVSLPPSDARAPLALIREARDRHPSLVIVACGTNAEASVVSETLLAGADGFLDQAADPQRFVEGLRRAARGEAVIEAAVEDWVGRVADGIVRRHDQAGDLTPRERQVLQAAADGLTARQIGHRLGMRERTVTTHLANIYRKLGAGTRVAAVTIAARRGLVSIERR